MVETNTVHETGHKSNCCQRSLVSCSVKDCGVHAHFELWSYGLGAISTTTSVSAVLTLNIHWGHASPPMSKARNNWAKMLASSSTLPCKLFSNKAQWLLLPGAFGEYCTIRHKLWFSRELRGWFFTTEKYFLQFSGSHPVVLCLSFGTFLHFCSRTMS